MPLVYFSHDDTDENLGIQQGDTIIAVDTVLSSDQEIALEKALENIAEFEQLAKEELSGGEPAETYASEAVNIRAPIDPAKIVRIEGSYTHDLDDSAYNPFIDTEGLQERDWPRFWIAPNSTLERKSEPLIIPTFAKNIKPGIELAFVLGRGGKYWTESEALESVAGCLIMVDIAIYDPLPGQWGYRFFDGAMRVGSGLVSPAGIDLSSIQLSLELNGKELDSRSTSGWRFSPGEMISTVSQIMTLESGDIVTSGDPMGIEQTVEDGDTLHGHITDIGKIETSIRREETDGGVLI